MGKGKKPRVSKDVKDAKEVYEYVKYGHGIKVAPEQVSDKWGKLGKLVDEWDATSSHNRALNKAVDKTAEELRTEFNNAFTTSGPETGMKKTQRDPADFAGRC